MRKLKLDPDLLVVESFPAGPGAPAPGTVLANVESNARCNSEISCDNTCQESCGDCGSYYCAATFGATCDLVGCNYTGGTSCNAPCLPTCDGANTCNAYNTCDQTCWQGCAWSDVYPPC